MKTADVPQKGTRGKVVASRNRFGQYHRERTPHKNHRTAAQKRVRGTMGELAQLWNQISEERRIGWRARAREAHTRRWMGKCSELDGPLLFKKLNSVLATCGKGFLLDAPLLPQFGPNPITAFTITNGAEGPRFILTVREAPVQDIMLFAWTPLNAGVDRNSNYVFLGLLPAAHHGQIDITELYLAKLKEWRKLKDKRYHVPLEGAKVFVRAWQQVNGWEDELGMFRASAFVPVKAATATRRAGRKAR
jgi:hypothetical protein